MNRRRHAPTVLPLPSFGIGVPADIIIRRRAALGDVLACSIIATRLHELGYRVTFATDAACVPVLQRHPHIWRIAIHQQTPAAHVDLTQKVEAELNKTASIPVRAWNSARAQLVGIDIGEPINPVPIAVVTEEERELARTAMERFPRPWIIFAPCSNHWPNRQIPGDIWQEAARQLTEGTCFWTGTAHRSGKRLVNLYARDVRRLMAVIAESDLVVSVDTGPIWMAAALRKPILHVQTAFAATHNFNEQVDWRSVSKPLDCAPCHRFQCPINEEHPPCQNISPAVLAAAIEARLLPRQSRMVSVVIPTLNGNQVRLRHCVDHLINHGPNVDEIIISSDGDKPCEIKDARVKVLPPPGKATGFGRTCNRGCHAANGDILVLLNDDCFVDGNAIPRLVQALDETPRAAVCGALLRYPDGRIQHGGGDRKPGDVGWGHRDHRSNHQSVRERTRMDFVTAALLAIRREAFFSVAGFDERYHCYHEDTDLLMRLKDRGWHTIYEPRAMAVHDESQTTSALKNTLIEKSRVIFEQRWAGWFSHREGAFR